MTPRRPREGKDLGRLSDFESLVPSVELRERVLASVEPTSRLDGFVARFARLFDLPETRAREILAAAEPTRPGWVATPLPGVRLFHFQGGARVATADCGLVHVAPGAAIPRHRHRGLEWNLVLWGCADEGEGAPWLPGDLVLRETDSAHRVHARGDEPLLLAMVLEAPIELLLGS